MFRVIPSVIVSYLFFVGSSGFGLSKIVFEIIKTPLTQE